MEKTLNIGVLGAGTMGSTHTRCWSRVPGARVVAIADKQPDKATRLADAIADSNGGAPDVVTDALELLARDDIDAVSICLPTPLHCPMMLAAAERGLHVLCEKPMSLTVADCDSMIAAASRAGIVFTVGQCVRYFPEYARAKQIVDSGAVGAPAAVRTRRGGDFPRADRDWYADPAQSGGVIFDLMVHDFDWLLWCFGPAERVYAKGLVERLAAGELDHLDYALVTIRHRGGVISHVEGAWSDPSGFSTTYEIAGDGGLLEHDSRKSAVVTRALRQSEGGHAGVVIPGSPLFPEDDPYYREIVAFANAIQHGKPLLVKPEEARAAVAVAAAATESIRTGRAVAVEAQEW